MGFRAGGPLGGLVAALTFRQVTGKLEIQIQKPIVEDKGNLGHSSGHSKEYIEVESFKANINMCSRNRNSKWILNFTSQNYSADMFCSIQNSVFLQQKRFSFSFSFPFYMCNVGFMHYLHF